MHDVIKMYVQIHTTQIVEGLRIVDELSKLPQNEGDSGMCQK